MAILMCGTLWNGNILGKLQLVKEKFRELREAEANAAAGGYQQI